MAGVLSTRVRIGAATVAALAGCLLALAATGSAAAAISHLDLDYDLGSPPAPSPASQNRLDLYLPDDAGPTDSRPVVVYVHGGGWRQGDKRNRILDKANLFTDAGYLFASINYRLSPEALSATPDPSRVMFPDHPHDVGEAIGWLGRNLASRGGDPERIALIGHSAGAHLVSLVATDPSYVEAYGVDPWQLIGAVALDTGAFDVPARIAELGPAGQLLYFNAFGTVAENAATGSWAEASPIEWADPADPAQLLVTQMASQARVQENRRMASALGQDPTESSSPRMTMRESTTRSGPATIPPAKPRRSWPSCAP
jgi:acetyl esterase/lipase